MYYSDSEIGLIVADALKEERDYWNDKWQLTYNFLLFLQNHAAYIHRELYRLGANHSERHRAEGIECGLMEAMNMMKLVNDPSTLSEITELLDSIMKKYEELKEER